MDNIESEKVLSSPSTQSSGSEPLYTPKLILDARLAGISDTTTYLVEKGAQNTNLYQERAASATPSGMSFNVVVPGLNTAVSRLVYLRSSITLQVKGVPAAGQYLVDLRKVALAPFPLQSMFQTCQTTINTTSMSIEMQDVLPKILRMMDKKTLDYYSNMCPTALDYFQNYGDALRTVSDVNGCIFNKSDKFHPRGCFPLNVYELDGGGNIVAPTVGDGAASHTVFVKFSVCEPLLMSPFVCDPTSNNIGSITGINALKFVFNLNGSNVRALRGVFNVANPANPANLPVVTLSNVSQPDTYLDFTYLSPFPSMKLPSRCVTPYLEVRKLSTLCPQINAGAAPSVGSGVNTPSTAQTIQSNTIQLNGIPDKLIISVGPRESDKNCTNSDSFLAIEKVRINFGNKTSILGTYNNQGLFMISKKNGLQDDWLQFQGYAACPASYVQPAIPAAGGADVGARTAVTYAGVNSFVQTSGSVLCLSFGEDLSLSHDWEAAGGLGVYQLQVYVDVANYSQAALANYELSLIVVNSGMLVTQLGSSTIYTNMLTSDEILKTSQQDPINHNSFQRKLGGSFWSNLKAVGKKIKPAASMARGVLNKVDNPHAKTASSLLSSLGAGRSAGSMSAGSRLKGRIY
jgi:hypothetical protein